MLGSFSGETGLPGTWTRGAAAELLLSLLKWDSYAVKFIIFKCTIQWVLVYSQGSTTITTIRFQNICISPKRNQVPICTLPIVLFTTTLSPATTNILSVSLDLLVSDISSKWSPTIYGLLGLASFIQCNVCKGRPFTVWTDHISFIHSSVEGHLVVSTHWLIMNNVAVDIHKFPQELVSKSLRYMYT